MNIALLGIGTIGSGAYEQINRDRGNFSDSVKEPSRITKVLDKDPNKRVEGAELTNNSRDIMEDDSIDLVIALMGGKDFEYEQIKEALKNKKHVVTANKAVIGSHFKELTDLAKQNQVMLRYEASAGGGIPVIKALESQLRNNEITDIKGILNGTTNFILTKMVNDKADFNEALREAQAIGFAEADPSADLNGSDIARKLAILSSIAFGSEIRDEDVKTRGLENIRAIDISEANRMGYRLKHLAQAKNDNGTVSLTVEPVLLKKDHPFSSVKNEFNVVSITGDVVDELRFYGKGAGKDATANAVVNDVMDIVEAVQEGRYLEPPALDKEIELNENKAFDGEYYIRILENNSKNLSLQEILDNVESVAPIKSVNNTDGIVYVFTRKVNAYKLDKMIADLGLGPDEVFYARIISD